MYSFIGKITEIHEVEAVTGKYKKKRTFVVEGEKDVSVLFMTFDANTDNLNEYEVGNKVEVQFTIKSYKRTKGWENVCFAVSIHRIMEWKYEKRENYKSKHAWEDTRSRQKTTNHFEGCRTKEDYKKRYRELCKKYHPDTGTGDAKIMSEVNVQYERYK